MIADLIKEFNKKLGYKAIMNADEAPNLQNIKRVPIGIPSIDVKIGGGIPRGRWFYLRGAPSTGKSFTCYKAIESFQHTCRNCNERLDYEVVVDSKGTTVTTDDGTTKKVITDPCSCDDPQPMNVLLLDLEKSYMVPWAERQGVDTRSLLVSQLESAEQAKFLARQAIDKGIDLLVIDSIAQFSTAAELEIEIDKKTRGGSAKVVNEMLRVVTAKMCSHGMDSPRNPTIMMINQIRASMSMYVADVSPGGQGLAFYSSVTLHSRRSAWILDKSPGGEEIKIGCEVEIRVDKNKTGCPGGKSSYKIYFKDWKEHRAGDTNYVEQILNLALFWGIVKKGGAWYKHPSFPEGKNGVCQLQGIAKTAAFLEEDADLVEAIFDEIKELEGFNNED